MIVVCRHSTAACGRVNSPFATLCALLAILLAGCDVQTYEDAASAFNDGNAPPPQNPPDPEPPTTPPPGGGPFGLTFSDIQENVFTSSCAGSSCHAGANPPQGLNLEAANSYAQLVGIASSQEPGILRVAAGDPDNSYLVHKLEGTAGTGGQMPPSTPLPQDEIDVIRQWIADGAIDDRTQSAGSIKVASMSPGAGAVLGKAPTRIIVGFDRVPDASTINALTFTLTASGGDGSFTDGNEIAVTATSIAVPLSNPGSAVLDLTGIELVDDVYQVKLAGEGASVILDHDANALSRDHLSEFEIFRPWH